MHDMTLVCSTEKRCNIQPSNEIIQTSQPKFTISGTPLFTDNWYILQVTITDIISKTSWIACLVYSKPFCPTLTSASRHGTYLRRGCKRLPLRRQMTDPFTMSQLRSEYHLRSRGTHNWNQVWKLASYFGKRVAVLPESSFMPRDVPKWMIRNFNLHRRRWSSCESKLRVGSRRSMKDLDIINDWWHWRNNNNYDATLKVTCEDGVVGATVAVKRNDAITCQSFALDRYSDGFCTCVNKVLRQTLSGGEGHRCDE